MIRPDFIQIAVPAAQAKVNLALSIRGKLENGLHAIQSVICPISLADKIELLLLPDRPQQRTCRVGLTERLARHVTALDVAAEPVAGLNSAGVDAAAAATISDLQSTTNLAARATEAFLAKCCQSQSFGFEISITKAIPFEAGLGGGSADAAAVLRGLSAWAGLDPLSCPILEVAGELGADVPALLCNEMVMVEGTGRFIVRLPQWAKASQELDHAELVVIKPPTGVSTAAAYAALQAQPLTVPADYLRSGSRLQQCFIVEPEARFQAVCRRLWPDLDPSIFRDSQAGALTYQGRKGRCLSPGIPSGESAGRDEAGSYGFFNDFQAVVAATDGEVAYAIELLVASGACVDVLLSGSGSAVVGLVKTNPSAKFCVDQALRKLPEGWFVEWAGLVPQGESENFRTRL